MHPIRLTIFSLLLIITLFAVPVVSAHPLGNFTINHYDGIHVTPDRISIDFVLDMAEIPAFQEISLLPQAPDGKPDPAALPAYAARQCGAIAASLTLRANGSPAALTPTSSAVSFPPGAAGLATLRLTCGYQTASLPSLANAALDFADTSYPDRIGWREIVVLAEGVPLQGNFATHSVSSQLTDYPQDMLSSPLDQRQVSFQVGAAAAPQDTQAKTSAPAAPWSAGARSDTFTQLITLQDTSPASILLALLIAFVWGGLHSLTPGHGKTIVGAYLVGSRGTARHAVYLGLMTTLTHTAGVFLLGLVTLFASRYLLPDQLFPWISVLSGLLVVVIGLALFIGRLRTTHLWSRLSARFTTPRAHRAIPPTGAPHPALTLTFSPAAKIPQNSILTPHHHADGSTHTHAGGTIHARDHAGGTAHTHAALETRPSGHIHLTAGLAPALNSPAGHTHPTAEHTHVHADGTVHTHPADEHDHTHPAGSHTHDPSQPGYHTHLPPGADGSQVTLRSLLALGISGGLLPCPSALVVMLGAIALNRIGFGIILVLFFSLGLASVLTAIGLAMVYARRFFEKLPVHNRFIELIPAGSALFIMVLGLGITFQALVQLGWIGV